MGEQSFLAASSRLLDHVREQRRAIGRAKFLVGKFIYDEAQNRAVSVHSSAIIEALRHVYDAGPLADELQVGKKQASR